VQKFDHKVLVHHILRNLPFDANSDQALALEALSQFVLEEDERGVFILRGYAGTGKTNLISALTKSLPAVKFRSVLLAPTGRAAKVLSGYAQRPASTIHRKIFKKLTGPNGEMLFVPGDNLHRNTLFIVDEASMIAAHSNDTGMGSILENLFEYVYSGINCKLLLVGDTAQLPPVGEAESPALDPTWLKTSFHLNIRMAELKQVARQKSESLILYNATQLRVQLANNLSGFPLLETGKDMVSVSGDELSDVLEQALSTYGADQVIIVTRSNKRANLFNQNYRNRIKLYEEEVCAGDRIMVVKNNYFWLPENNGEAAFIANGDIAEITAIRHSQTLYDLKFCDVTLKFVDYPNLPEQEVKILIDLLHKDQPALTQDDMKLFYAKVQEDVANEPIKAVRQAYVKNSPYYHALQVKFSYAITCHKSQGGQWPAVFIDLGYMTEEMAGPEFIRWLYTALTRASEKVYLINFPIQMLKNSESG